MNLHTHTPTLMVIDARGLSVRQVRFCRSDDLSVAEPRIVRQVFDLPGRLVSSFDSRLALPHTSTISNLSGAALLSNSVDAGWQVNLSGASGQVLEAWDSRGNRTSISHDALLRPVAVVEQCEGQAARTVERFTYGDASTESAAHNQCGQLLRRDDPAGSSAFLAFGLTGACLRQQRRFLLELDQPDWPVAMSERDAWLETDNYVSSSVVGPLDDVIESCDAQGHRQLRDFGLSGQLKRVSLKLANAESTLTLVSDIRYNALGAVEQETAGNGVISTAVYDEGNGRLLRLRAQSDERTFQNLNYAYDPVGNVVSIEDAAQSTGHFSQQRTDPVNRYRYDSLYQLIEATGREVATFSHGPHLPSFQTLPLDAGCMINYTQRFEYDAGGNLLTRHHSGAETWCMAVSSTSNRSLPLQADGTLPDEGQIIEAFDGNGNLKALQPGQAMMWDARNQLSEVTAVKREDGPDDSELYRYDGEGQRVRKVRVSLTRSRTLTARVRYLPGLEIHRNEATGEVRHVLTIEAGRNSVRLLHWESGKPDGVENDQLRYSLSDHLGSSTLELDQDAKLISHEGYYPFGGTAWWTARNAVEASYKTVRYSGKERDATGLYYYGSRYYAPWLQRWVNPDPAGDIDGKNLYLFVSQSPVSKRDPDGNRGEHISYFSSGLRDRLQDASNKAIHRYDSVKKFKHKDQGHGIFGSSVWEGTNQSVFTSKMKRHKWTIIHAYKKTSNHQAYYANEVFQEQYVQVATERGFFGYLPSVVKIETVDNSQTLAIAKRFNEGQDFKEDFLTAPLGKMSHRLMTDFGLEIMSVNKKTSGGTIDIYLNVRPTNHVDRGGHSTADVTPSVFDTSALPASVNANSVSSDSEAPPLPATSPPHRSAVYFPRFERVPTREISVSRTVITRRSANH
jgi:insecticidal toxin complex protein TccC